MSSLDTLVALLKTDLQLPAAAPDGAAQKVKQQIEALDGLALADAALVAKLEKAIDDSMKPDAEIAALLKLLADTTQCEENVKQHKLQLHKSVAAMSAVPDDAFSVHCGLGETMTAEDVLEGILRVTVLVAMVRPAEFIEITFQQQMTAS